MNTAYKAYTQLAYRKAIVAMLQRVLLEHLPAESVGAVRVLDCDDVLASDKAVPEDAFSDFLDELREEEDRLSRELSMFEFRRRELRGKPEKQEDHEESSAGSGEEGSENSDG